MAKYLEVENLKTYFKTQEGIVKSVDGISFSIEEGKTLALVGESGCGKTVTSLSMMQLLPKNAILEADKLLINGKDVMKMTDTEKREMRGTDISMIFQEPMTSLNPAYRIEKQLGEVFKLHNPNLSKKEIYEKSLQILSRVGIPNPEERIKAYPHQLSGGLRQRTMIAISLAAQPKLVIADEPTTALDVTIQAQILELLKDLQKEFNMSILLITHDFGVVSEIADEVAVMYAGKIVEQGSLYEVFNDSWHPYTKRLINSIPGIKVNRGERLESIPGTVPNPLRLPEGCRFAPRCEEACEICHKKEPGMTKIGEHLVSCFLKEGQTNE